MVKALTVKQEKFVQKYLECGNASEAYRNAYATKGMTAKTINEEASRTLADRKVAARLAELQAKVDKRAELNLAEVANMLSDVVMADITDYVEPNGSIRVDAIKRMPIEKRRLIESIEATRNGVKISLVGKMSAIERLAKLRGWDAPAQSEIKLTNELERYTDAELAAIMDGKQG
jgi:phage terminase small subunit